MQLYRASDQLVKHRDAIEAHLFDRALGLFDLQPTVTLYDLTNTYFEGEANEQPQAKRGHSKQKRSDCPLLTLGLMLDASGFVRRSKVFTGNVREHRTLAGMLDALDAPAGALVVVDRGVATEAAITWLRENHYRYLVVSRERHRQFDADAAVSIQTQSKQTVHLHKVVSTDPGEVRLYCYSEERAEKERGIVERFATRFEAALTKLNDGLSRPRAHKRLDQVWQRIGRLKARHTRVAAHYQINVTADETGNKAVAVTWTRRPQDGSMVTHPGVYCLRSSETDWDEDTLWRTYTTLTDVEAVFRSLKSELGLRPIYHRKPRRADGHLFITVIRLPARPAHPNPPARPRQPRLLDNPQTSRRRSAARHRHLPTARRPHPPRAHRHATRTRAARRLRRPRRRPAPRRRPQDDRLTHRPLLAWHTFVVPLEPLHQRKSLILKCLGSTVGKHGLSSSPAGPAPPGPRSTTFSASGTPPVSSATASRSSAATPTRWPRFADSLDFQHKYTSGVIAWAPEDRPTDAQIEAVLDKFEKTAWAGLEPDRYAWTAVEHRELGGGVHVHVLAARCDLETGKSLNIAPPGWEKTFGPLRDGFNHTRGWSRPDDPARARAQQPGHRALIDAANLRAGLEVEADPRELIRDYLMQRVEHGYIHSRADVVAALKDAGLDVPRQGEHYVTARDPETGKRWRLKGALYEHDFQPERLGRPAAAEAGDRPAGDRGDSDGRAAAAWRELEQRCAERAALNRRRYGASGPSGPRSVLMRAWLLPAAAGLSLFLVICAGSWGTMRWLSMRIESQLQALAILNVDIEQARKTLTQFETMTWRVDLLEIDGERFVVLPAGSLERSPWRVGGRPAVKLSGE